MLAAGAAVARRDPLFLIASQESRGSGDTYFLLWFIDLCENTLEGSHSLYMATPLRCRQTKSNSLAAFHRLEPQHRAVRVATREPQLGGYVEIAVGTLLHVAYPDVERPQERLAPFCLRRLTESDAL